MKSSELIATSIALVSLSISALTAWLTLFRQGPVRMTRPNIVAFGREGLDSKLFLRFLLRSTAQKGNVVESLYATLGAGRNKRIFATWGYGDSQRSLVRGSELFVGREGISINHHFVCQSTVPQIIEPGTHMNRIYGAIIGQKKDQLLYEFELKIEDKEARGINKGESGVIYDWDAYFRRYYP